MSYLSVTNVQRVACSCMLMVFASLSWAQDPLPSWNEGEVKQSILEFVRDVSTVGSERFVPAEERIAVFDNDGTLWCEYPIPNQAAFAFDEIQRMLPESPEWQDDPAVKALLAGDVSTLKADHHHGLLRIMALTHSGMTVEEFDTRVAEWLSTARHPRFDRPYTETVYQPMLELLAFLRDNGFQTWIVSGGGQDFMRVFAQDTYSIPPQQVVGSYGRLKYELKDGKPQLTKTLDTLFVDDREGKPVGIQQFIGRRPIACFGNSDGDQAMLEYTTIDNPNPSFGLIVHHTDAEREYAYDANPTSSGKLVTALEAASQNAWTIVDMQRDWKQVFTDSNHMSLSQTIIGKWLAEDIDAKGIVDNAQSTLELAADGSLSGSTSVNRYSGKATIEAARIQIGPLASTRRAGPPALMEQERRFLQALEKTASYAFTENGMLQLLDSNGQVLARFSRVVAD
ncbi:MAG: META domain-containing protein [bacterium]|nr:META domain-containing protein [bacterium]